MKPAFALSFSKTGISLHHQSDDEWFCVGSVPLDAPDLNDQIKALHDQGFALENDLSCKLVIPPDQVRHLSIDTDGLDAQASDQKIRDTLDEATPYDLNDLVYTTATDGSATHIIAVARQTLDEACAFATDHGFVPVGFIASTTGGDALTGPSVELTTQPNTLTPDTDTDTDTDTDATPEPDEPEVPVHPIANAPAPDAFVPQDPVVDPKAVSINASDFDLKRLAIPVVAASVVLGMIAGAWSFMRSGPEVDLPSEQPAAIEAQTASLPQPEPDPVDEAADATPTDDAILEALNVAPEVVETITPDDESASDTAATLSPTDEAILEALAVEPEQTEDITPADDPEPEVLAVAVTIPEIPGALLPPVLLDEDELYLSSIDRSDMAQDSVALPGVESLNTDTPFDVALLPRPAEQSFELDNRGLVAPSPEGTLNPDGILVFEGTPKKKPPEPPVRFESEPELAEPLAEPDERLAGFRPRPRPDNLIDQFERRQLGGRSREELATLRPKLRPKSIEDRPVVDHTPTALAVVRVPRPKPRPKGLAVRVSQKSSGGSATLGSTANVAASDDEAGTFQPKSVSPKIPTTASVARQATIDNAINLRKLNLIGVYGTPANRRALVRLPSGRYKKLKVGDRIDGGNVLAIGDSELRYQKRGKNVTLKMPRG